MSYMPAMLNEVDGETVNSNPAEKMLEMSLFDSTSTEMSSE